MPPAGTIIRGLHKVPDGSIEFEYDGTSRKNVDGLTWIATVRFKGPLVMNAAGAMPGGADAAADEALVHAAVVRSALDRAKRAR